VVKAWGLLVHRLHLSRFNLGSVRSIENLSLEKASLNYWIKIHIDFLGLFKNFLLEEGIFFDLDIEFLGDYWLRVQNSLLKALSAKIIFAGSIMNQGRLWRGSLIIND